MSYKSLTSVSPYYDDFDATKNFHRILFRPGRAVQARELTQSQTILQDQVISLGEGTSLNRNSQIFSPLHLNENYLLKRSFDFVFSLLVFIFILS